MRRFEKKAILEMLDTLNEAHKEYRKYRDNGDSNACVSVLTECQESAVSIGNAIEKSEGDGTESVSLLEKYCEDLYQESLGNSADIDDDIIQIRSCIKNEIQVKLEVVFFPYKAQMWDAMESIYLSFKKEKNVHVTLVPIPYYNRNNDGTAEAMHCEADLFPDNEPVTDWREYDIASIKPDIAFIHNPYDDSNFVTSVDPMYYSWELKKNVDCLVYCPYFSTVGGMGKGQALCKSYFYVNYIVAQSQFQIDFYDASVPKEKFLVAGSPKFDKVIRLTRQKNDYPDTFFKGTPSDWRKKCEGKRVYFYNTSISGLLADTPAFLEKMQYVFSTFEKQDDAVLLWRPHPLFDDTFKALRPEYYEEYLGIKENFTKNKKDILDETPDISKSVALCDAFIGDGGTSVTSLFGVTGKPIFLLDNNIMREPTDQDIMDQLFVTPVLQEQDGYAVSGGNLLFKCDYPFKDRMEFRYVTKLSDYSSQLYGNCFRYGDDLYITPICTEDVKVLHRDGSLSTIQLRHCSNRNWQFFNSVIYQNRYIFLIPNEYFYIVRIDLETGQVDYTEDLRTAFVYENKNMESMCGGITFFNDQLVLGSLDHDMLLMIDVNSLNHQLVAVGEDDGSGCAVCYVPELSNKPGVLTESIWILPYKGYKLRQFYPYSGEIKEYDLSIHDIVCSDPDRNSNEADIRPFSSAVMKDGILYVAPYRGNKFILIDTVSGESHEWNFPVSIEWQGYNRFFTGDYRGVLFGKANRFFWISGTERRIYELSISPYECRVIREIPVTFDIDEIKDHAYGFADQGPWSRYEMDENAINPLSRFISGQVYGAQFDSEKQIASYHDVAVNLDGTCGQHVCDFLMKKMELS